MQKAICLTTRPQLKLTVRRRRHFTRKPSPPLPPPLYRGKEVYLTHSVWNTAAFSIQLDWPLPDNVSSSQVVPEGLITDGMKETARTPVFFSLYGFYKDFPCASWSQGLFRGLEIGLLFFYYRNTTGRKMVRASAGSREVRLNRRKGGGGINYTFPAYQNLDSLLTRRFHYLS